MEGNPAGLSSCSGGLRPLVELCMAPVGLCGRCISVGDRDLGLHSRLPRGVRPRLEGKPRTPLSSAWPGEQFRVLSPNGSPAGLSSCSGGLRPLVELCMEPAGLCGRCTGWQCPFVLCLHPQGCLQRGSDSSATPSFPSQPEGKIGLPRANPRGRLRSPS